MCQVEGVAHLGNQDQDVAPEVRRLPAAACRGAGDEQHGSREAHDDAQRPSGRDALVQQDGRQDEREDGHRGQLDGGIDGRSETQANNIATLGQREAEEARPGNLNEVPWLHPLLRHNQ